MVAVTLTRSASGMWAWAAGRALAARDVPASGAEHAAWTVRGWAEIALGCALLGPAAFDGLDTVILATRIRRGGPAADRLRALRGRAGPVPRGYPSSDDPGPVDGPGEETREACRALAAWCATIPDRDGPVRPVRDHLRWGERHRPAATRDVTILDGSRFTGLAWRTWMRLPGERGLITVLVDHTHRAPELRRRVWRGIHDGAHLDHLAACGEDIEFGRGLLAAETYAMAVELVALAETRDAAVRRILKHGVLERIARIPGNGADNPELQRLPTLAATYVTGALRLLGGGAEGVPARLREPLRARWVRATAGAARCRPSLVPAR
ncbi:hypothetical protein [Herbidospora mongoliensis]|uniref:hypothetical protein n=1 Tax=Herbidospora mongoliensis TaxID=688067 RepID=UPI000832D205|nr:hypothetical protein [Herbidospora mongoliensis]